MTFSKKITAIVVPGLGFSSDYTDSILFQCSIDFNIIRFDLPGHCSNTENVIDVIDKIKSYIDDSYDNEKIILIGWSIGGSIILKSIEDKNYKNNLSVLIIEQSPKMINGRDWEYGLFGTLNENQVYDMFKKIKSNGKYMLSQLIPNMIYSIDFSEKLKKYLATDINNNLVAELFKTVSYWDLRTVIYKTSLPICFIFSDHGLIYPKELYGYMLKYYSRPKNVHLIKRCGHALFIEQSIYISKIINKFIEDNFYEVLYE